MAKRFSLARPPLPSPWAKENGLSSEHLFSACWRSHWRPLQCPVSGLWKGTGELTPRGPQAAHPSFPSQSSVLAACVKSRIFSCKKDHLGEQGYPTLVELEIYISF